MATLVTTAVANDAAIIHSCGWVGTRFSVKKGHHWIRAFVIVMVVIFSAKLLWDSLFTQ